MKTKTVCKGAELKARTERIRRMYLDYKMPLKEIAGALGLEPSYISRVMNRDGFRRHKKRNDAEVPRA